ncbi:MAG TPA: hypothetical protein VGM27_01770 [Acidobacteriaceae bacterium]
MRLPWISRHSHNEMMGLVKAQLSELAEERRRLLDRLASIGLGGPLYVVTEEAIHEEPSVTEEATDPEQVFMEQIMRLRHRPAKLADTLTRRANREHSKRGAGPKIAWVPQTEKINAALDEAEALGRAFSRPSL